MDCRYRQYFDAMPCYVTVQDRDFTRHHRQPAVPRGLRRLPTAGFCYQVYKQPRREVRDLPGRADLPRRPGPQQRGAGDAASTAARCR